MPADRARRERYENRSKDFAVDERCARCSTRLNLVSERSRAKPMAWYDDLAECDYFGGASASSLRAVGWLERGHTFAEGAVDGEVYARLLELLKHPWEPAVARGTHTCNLCLYEGERGKANLFLPGNGFLYVCPELIVHYMNAHGYKPPAEFCHAVLACPPMRSVTYLQGILANGGRSLVRAGSGSTALDDSSRG